MTETSERLSFIGNDRPCTVIGCLKADLTKQPSPVAGDPTEVTMARDATIRLKLGPNVGDFFKRHLRSLDATMILRREHGMFLLTGVSITSQDETDLTLLVAVMLQVA